VVCSQQKPIFGAQKFLDILVPKEHKTVLGAPTNSNELFSTNKSKMHFHCWVAHEPFPWRKQQESLHINTGKKRMRYSLG